LTGGNMPGPWTTSGTKKNIWTISGVSSTGTFVPIDYKVGTL
jgi:hypothetical protein